MSDSAAGARGELGDDDIARRRDQVRDRLEGRNWRRGLIGGTTASSHGSAWRERGLASRAIHRLGEGTAHAVAGMGAALLVLIWTVIGLAVAFPAWWQTVLYSSTASVTFVMVFAIQHTQARQQTATQRKLDELIRAMQGADDRVIAAEEAADEELEALAKLNIEDHDRASSEQGPVEGR